MATARIALACLALGLTLAASAGAKGIASTVCGRSACRTVENGIAGIATLPGRGVTPPRSGRFYTIELGGPHGWKVVYEARRQVVRAADSRARSFLGRDWALLAPDVRAHFARAVRGLAPLRAAPR